MATKRQIRVLVAKYMRSEGCGCCCGGNHDENSRALCKALDFPPYTDGSGYDYEAVLTEEAQS